MLRSGRSGTETGHPPRATLWWARIVCLSVFGPYVTGSARTEQIMVFASFAVILIVGWPQIVNARSIPAMPFLAAWLGLDAIMLIGTVWRPFDPGFYGPQPVSHALAAYMLPVALMVLTWFWTLSADGPELIRAIAPVVIGAMVVNTAVSLAQLVTGKVAVLSFLPRFWDTPGSPGSVAANAAGNSRFTGIFNQPAEAGVAYGVALFCLIYLAQRREIRAGTTALCAAALITGGILTVSKVFLLGALPLAVMMTLRSPRGRVRVIVCCRCRCRCVLAPRDGSPAALVAARGRYARRLSCTLPARWRPSTPQGGTARVAASARGERCPARQPVVRIRGRRAGDERTTRCGCRCSSSPVLRA